MHILIIAPEQITVPPILGGSVEIVILAMAKRLARSHRVTVISRSHPRYPQHSRIDGVDIYRVPTGSPMTYLSNVKKWIGNKSFDVIQINNRPRFVGPLKQKFQGTNTPVTLFLHSLTFVGPPFTSRATAAQDLAKTDLILANSSSLKQQLSSRFPGVAGRIRSVWLGVDTKRFSPARKSKTSNAFKVLFTGRVIPRKGVPVLLKAVKLAQSQSARPIHVMIAGGSSRSGYMSQMRSLASNLRVNAQFLGNIPHSRIHHVYKKADVFVCPSQKHEAFGLVNVEAMASGLPVIASNNGGIKEIVKNNRNGILVKSYHRPQAFAKAILKLSDDRALRNRMSLQARRDCVKRFSWGATANRITRVYSKYRKSKS
ncbi:glycosyltransferase family 4 protein [Cohnella cholangitidis]|uniref:Glycosyltransferase family 4 protein n=1 Tax=Cohnella cholangitidis TaxID=2598458 RepID=A0A7G5C3H4_9BACL|nr:glycosyltransferase family 4 protein [Cohnella cholangitidis]QMV43758.1 glycosyltransferase family 4 protein [Cohnella cholangitidis]